MVRLLSFELGASGVDLGRTWEGEVSEDSNKDSQILLFILYITIFIYYDFRHLKNKTCICILFITASQRPHPVQKSTVSSGGFHTQPF